MKSNLLFIPIFLVLLNLSLFSQDMKIFGQVSAGVSIPAIESDFPDNYKTGFNVGVASGSYLSEYLALRASVFYNNFQGKNLPANTSSSFNLVSISGDIVLGDFKKNSKINPYGFAGLSSYVLSIKTTVYGASVSSSDTKIGFQLGGGVNIKTSSNLGFFAEATFNYIFNDGYAKGYVPLRVGANYNF